MILFVFAGALIVGGVLLSRKWDYEVFGFVAVMVGSIGLLIMTIAAGSQKLGIAGELASTGQLRSAAARVNLQSSEDVMGKVADFNQSLAQAKWMNQQWWGDPFVPDEWDTVSFIPIDSK